MTGMSFDIGKSTGIAIWTDSTPHVIRLNMQYSYFGQVLVNFNDVTQDLMTRHRPEWLAYEEVMVKNKYHAELHFGMVGILAMSAYHQQIPLLGINTMTMKKHVTGKGNASKEDTVAEMQRRYPRIADLTHDMADAIGVGLVALSQMEDSGT